MTDSVTSQNIDLSSWDTLYKTCWWHDKINLQKLNLKKFCPTKTVDDTAVVIMYLSSAWKNT